jgi:diguanylate cyclase
MLETVSAKKPKSRSRKTATVGVRRASTGTKMSALRRSELFSAVGLRELQAAAERSRVCTYPAGQAIFGKGDPGDALFVVIEGSVRVLGDDDGGRQSVIAELVPGDTFGEVDLLDNTPRDATAIAATDTAVVRFPADGRRLDRVFAADPGVLAEILFSSMKVIAGRIRRANALIKENSPWIQEARRQAYGDKLTGLYNKAYLEERLPALLKAGGPTALVLLKPDNFKQINDTYGHEAGDTVLRLMAAELARQVHGQEFAARHVGNALAVALPACGRTEALKRAQAIHSALQALDLSPAVPGADVRLSVSLGVTIAPDHGHEAAALIATAAELPLAGRAKGGGQILFPEDVASGGAQ